MATTETSAVHAAIEVSESFGLVLDGTRLIDSEGRCWSPEQFTLAVETRLAAIEGERTRGEQRRTLARLARARAALGKTLLAGADVAYAEAMRHAGVKVNTRARRQSSGRQVKVAEAVEGGEPLGPLMQQVGLHETEVLAGAFETYREIAREAFEAFHERQALILEQAGHDPELVKVGDIDAAVEHLVHGLLALVRQTLIEGTSVAPSMLAASRVQPKTPRAVVALKAQGTPSTVAKRAKPSTPAILRKPKPRRVPAKLITNAIKVADGRARSIPPESPDLMPTIGDIPGAATVESELAREGWHEWMHGFYGEPTSPFDPHGDLDGIETRAPQDDERFTNDEAFPDGEFYQPGDHDGCTCELVLVV